MTVLVTGAGGFIGGHLVDRLLQTGLDVRAVDVKPLDEWYQVHDDAENVVGRLLRPGRRAQGRRRHRRDLQPRRRHGRHGLHREQQGRVHAVGAHQHPHAGRRARRRHEAVLLQQLGLRLQRRQADRPERHRPQGGRRLPGRPRGRLRLGEALHRADGPPLPRGLRPRDPRRPLPQRLRPARHVGRRPREGARRAVPQGRRGRSSGTTTTSRSGATASRPAASCTSTTASAAPWRSWPATSSSRSTSARPSWSRSTRWSTSSRTSPASRSSAATTSTPRRASAAATATTRCSSQTYGWEPSISLRDGLEKTYAWIYDQLKARG